MKRGRRAWELICSRNRRRSVGQAGENPSESPPLALPMKSSSSRFVRFRLLTGLAFCLAGIFLAVTVFAQGKKLPLSKQTRSAWPSVDQQITQEYLGRAVEGGSALEKLIRENQDFTILHEGEK